MAHVTKRRKSPKTVPHDYFADETPVLLNIPQMQKPFDYGWEREIVYQQVGAGQNCDIFYIAPCGKRLTSRKEVEKYLNDHLIGYLSPDWFSFNNHVLVGGGEKERSRVTTSTQPQVPWRRSKWSTVVICTRYCPERNNNRPSLQCMSCSAFYHPECVFLSKLEAKKQKYSYTCTRCMLEENPNALKIKIKLVDVSPILKLSFDCLLHIFSYLHTADLCSVSSVCTTWNHVSAQPVLWRRVSFQGIEVNDWDTVARWMTHFSTVRLDMRGMVHGKNREDSWLEITNVLRQLTQLRWLDFGLVPATVLQDVADFLPDLEVLTAEWISDVHSEADLWTYNTRLDVGKLSQLTSLRRLQLRAACAGLLLPTFAFSGGLTSLQSLAQLKKLCLTTLRDIPATEFQFLKSLSRLEELEIGDCTNWTSETFECLGTLKHLTSLRLECGSNLHSDALPGALLRLQRLVHLELIMFGVTAGLHDALQTLPFLRTLSLWPQQTSRDTSQCLRAVCSLSELRCFDWGVLSGQAGMDYCDVSLFHHSLNELFPKDTTIVPVAPQLCRDLLKGLSIRKDSNGNANLSLSQLRSIIGRALPHADIRVFPVPNLCVQRLYFTV